MARFPSRVPNLTVGNRCMCAIGRIRRGAVTRMDFAHRQALYRQIEAERSSKVLAYATSDRPGMETRVAQDAINPFIDLLDHIGPTKRISLVLYTNGGDTLAAWRLVNLVRTFCDDFEVIVPLKALSAGTLIAIGADRIVMTKQAALGPIDPSVEGPLNPTVKLNGQEARLPVSVESVRGYLDAARKELGIKGEEYLTQVLVKLSEQVHPLVLGNIFRSREQIRFLARKLLAKQVRDAEKIDSIVDFLCAESGSHDYTINRREAADLGLSVDKPSESFYPTLKALHASFVEYLEILKPYSQQAQLAALAPSLPAGARGGTFTVVRNLVEGTDGGSYGFVSDIRLTEITVPTPAGNQIGVQDLRTFEGWRKLS